MTAWTINLFDDESEHYGPKERQTHPEPNPNPKRKLERDLGVGGNGWLAEGNYHQRGNAPPLDWWVIDAEVCACGFRHDD